MLLPCLQPESRSRLRPNLSSSTTCPSKPRQRTAAVAPVAAAAVPLWRKRRRQHRPCRDGAAAASSAAEAAPAVESSRDSGEEAAPPLLLEVEGLRAEVSASAGRGQQAGRRVLRGVSLSVREGEVHALMGRNGCGKSTLAKVLAGHPDYVVTAGSATFKGHDLLALKPQHRARLGLFLGFQSPVELPGVANIDFLRLATNMRLTAAGLPELGPLEFYAYVTPILEALKMDSSFLNRDVNKGFSGGERKRNEILQLACLQPDLAILDELDSGLDIDALHDVAAAVNGLRQRRPRMALLLITHYKRLLDLIHPNSVHIMHSGRIATSGGMQLVEQLEACGYASLTEALGQ